MSRGLFYVLNERHEPVPTDPLTASRWMAAADRVVRQDTLPDGTLVSTVFLALDHNYGPDGPPLLFETMVFPPGAAEDRYCDRYPTWLEAEAGHAAVLAQLRGAESPRSS